MLKFFNKLNLIKIINKKLIDAKDCVRKYFNEVSTDNKFFEFEIRGINLNKLISNPIQHPNHEFEEIEINVLKNRINKKNILFELLFVKIKKNINIFNRIINSLF